MPFKRAMPWKNTICCAYSEAMQAFSESQSKEWILGFINIITCPDVLSGQKKEEVKSTYNKFEVGIDEKNWNWNWCVVFKLGI